MGRRTAIPNTQKASLRAYRRLHPYSTIKHLQKWFLETYNHSLSASSISEILSSRYNFVDEPLTQHSSNSKRHRREYWPELEEALFLWIRRVEGQVIISGELIKEKARFFWGKLPVYEGKEMPTFSNGWLSGFQSRRSIKTYKQHGEAGSLPDEAFQEMIAIRQALSTYCPRDVFNCDETALFWKQIPDRSLSTRSLPGKKKEKARISALFCCNADGSERLPTWYIGTAKRPRAFQAAGIQNIQNLNVFWRSNRKAWMTSIIFEEWLRWFDSRMTGRRVVLLMDGFSAHKLAAETIQKSHPLQNTLLIWLPPNSSSHFQPLDQGIIHTWKAYWKRQWVLYILQEHEENRDPMATMNVLKALRWGIQAWHFDISQETLQKCFKKALFSQDEFQDERLSDTGVISDISKAFNELQTSSRIRDLMDINQFLNPDDEGVQDSPDDIEEQIISQFGQGIEVESEEETDVLPRITLSEALEAMNKFQLFEEQQEEGNQAFIQELLKRKQSLLRQKLESQRQQDIRSFFTA